MLETKSLQELTNKDILVRLNGEKSELKKIIPSDQEVRYKNFLFFGFAVGERCMKKFFRLNEGKFIIQKEEIST